MTLCKNVKKWSNASQKDETILGQNFSAGLYSIAIVYVHRMDVGEYQLMLENNPLQVQQQVQYKQQQQQHQSYANFL
jgi:hypothetical protein